MWKALLLFLVYFTFSSEARVGGSGMPPPPPAPYITDLAGESCQTNQTCQSRYTHSFCKSSDSACHCETGYVSSSNRKLCLPADVLLGGSCEENQQCTFWETATSVCLTGSGICDCVPGFIPSDNLSQCLPVINELGTQSCLEDSQCQLGKPGRLSRCIRRSKSAPEDFKVCKCTDDAVNAAKDNKCYRVAEYPGDKCVIQAQCTKGLKHSRCMDKLCECNHGYHSRQLNGKTMCVASAENSL